jgi:hypothetical protein
MGFILSILGSVFSGLFNKASNIDIAGVVKSVIGDRSERDAAVAAEAKAVQEGYQAEFTAPERHGFNALVDGINRLVRPLFTYGIISLFIWAAIDPVGFTVAMTALGVVPEMLWYIIATIIAFWFGSRIIEKAPMRVGAANIAQIKSILGMQQQLSSVKDNGNKYASGSSEAVISPPEVPETTKVSFPKPKTNFGPSKK